MWYDVDFNRWVEQLTPPILRSKVLLAFLKILVLPIFILHQDFLRHKEQAENKLNTTSQVALLESYLCREFYLKNREIYIEDIADKYRLYIYFENEKQISPFINNELIVRQKGSVPNKPNFVVYVPTFLCSSLNKDEDKHNGKYLNRIVNIIDNYKPAGRLYQIELYEL